MVFGVPGRTGLSVPRPVVEERLRGEENVTVLHQHMVVNSVRVMLHRVEIVAKINVSCFFFCFFFFLISLIGHVDGSWGPWEAWSQCTRTCGGGKAERTRECDDNGGRDCEGHATQTRDCNKDTCKFLKETLKTLMVSSFHSNLLSL